MDPQPTTILSPHLDDAALSCWHLLGAPGEVDVVNVFAGAPDAPTGAYWWDRLTGATDSVERVRERRAEDREALGLAGREGVNLDFLDEQYREGGQPLEEIVEQLREAIRPGGVVYAPAALDAQPDHRLVRDAALELWRSGLAVRLYADIPHAITFGWPAWVNGSSPSRLDVDGLWQARLAGGGIKPDLLTPAVHALDPLALGRKLEAVRAYRTQAPALEATYGPLDERALGHEVVWRLPSHVGSREMVA